MMLCLWSLGLWSCGSKELLDLPGIFQSIELLDFEAVGV